MLNEGINEVINLNKEFYKKHLESFDKSRSYGFWEGFEEILPFIPENLSILDLGCGNARFLKFLKENKLQIRDYLGIDNNPQFIEENSKKYPRFRFEIKDVILDNISLTSKYSLVVGFGITHHIPSKELRNDWFLKMSKLVASKGILVLSFWNFDVKKADKSFKIQSYKQEAGDYFLGWKGDFSTHRFCHFFDEDEIKEIIEKLKEFNLIHKFKKDSNTYIVLRKK